MPIISSIPKLAEEGFKELATIKEETFQAIQQALSSVPPKSSMYDLAKSISNLSKIDSNIIERFFLSVEGLFSFIDEEREVEIIAEDVISICISNKAIDDGQATTLRHRLLALLNEKRILFASKATDLMKENGNFFYRCRVLTDIRPVFDFDVEELPKAGIIMHTLHIHYQEHSEGPHKDFYITLEPYDVDVLVNALMRAKKKEESLKDIFSISGMSNLNEE